MLTLNLKIFFHRQFGELCWHSFWRIFCSTENSIFVFTFKGIVGAFVTWRWLSVACLGLSLLWSLTVLVNPESPAYLMSHKDFDGARASLQKLRGHDYIGNVQFYFVWWQYWPLDSALKIINFSKKLVFQKRNLVENQFLLIRNFAKNQFFKRGI